MRERFPGLFNNDRIEDQQDEASDLQSANVSLDSDSVLAWYNRVEGLEDQFLNGRISSVPSSFDAFFPGNNSPSLSPSPILPPSSDMHSSLYMDFPRVPVDGMRAREFSTNLISSVQHHLYIPPAPPSSPRCSPLSYGSSPLSCRSSPLSYGDSPLTDVGSPSSHLDDSMSSNEHFVSDRIDDFTQRERLLQPDITNEDDDYYRTLIDGLDAHGPIVPPPIESFGSGEPSDELPGVRFLEGSLSTSDYHVSSRHVLFTGSYHQEEGQPPLRRRCMRPDSPNRCDQPFNFRMR